MAQTRVTAAWHGPGRASPNRAVTVYNAVMLGEAIYHVGDDVLLRNPDPGAPPFVGRIRRLWQRRSGAMLMATQWYFRPTDIPPDQRPSYGPNEIFASELVDTNSVAALVGPAAVVFGSASGRVRASGVFYVTRQYHQDTHTFTPCLTPTSGAFQTGFRIAKSTVRRPSAPSHLPAPAKAGATTRTSSTSRANGSHKRPRDHRRSSRDEEAEEEGADEEDDVGDSDGSNDDDGSDLVCVCGGEGEGLMVQCDLCDGWYHTACVNLTALQARSLKSYICDSCARVDDDRPPRRWWGRCLLRSENRRAQEKQLAPMPTPKRLRLPANAAPPTMPHTTISDLPTELLAHILGFLSVFDRVRCMRVSRTWQHVLRDPSMWRRVVVEFANAIPLRHLLDLARGHNAGALVLRFTGNRGSAAAAWDGSLQSLRGRTKGPATMPPLELVLVTVPATAVAALLELRSPAPLTGLAALDLLVAPGEAVQLAPLLAATSATTWRLEAQRPFALPAFALESPLAGLASLDRLTSLSLRYLTEGAAADPDAWEAIIDGLPGLKELRVGVCTAWSPDLFAALARLRSLEVLGLTGLPTPDLEGADQPVPALTALGRTLADLPSLRELHLTDFLLTPDLASGMRRAKNLARIELTPFRGVADLLHHVHYQSPANLQAIEAVVAALPCATCIPPVP